MWCADVHSKLNIIIIIIIIIIVTREDDRRCHGNHES